MTRRRLDRKAVFAHLRKLNQYAFALNQCRRVQINYENEEISDCACQFDRCQPSNVSFNNGFKLTVKSVGFSNSLVF